MQSDRHDSTLSQMALHPPNAASSLHPSRHGRGRGFLLLILNCSDVPIVASQLISVDNPFSALLAPLSIQVVSVS